MTALHVFLPAVSLFMVHMIISLDSEQRANKTLYELFVNRNGVGPFPIELSSDASCADLYEITRRYLDDGLLSLGGVLIPDSERSVADCGITPECVLSLDPIPLWYSLYLFAKQFDNPEAIRWWFRAQSCFMDPLPRECSAKSICSLWEPGHIVCDANHSIVALRIGFIPYTLSGHLTFDMLPASLKKLYIVNHDIRSVDFSGLRGKSLWCLVLYRNDIQAINFRELIGTKVELLDVAGNNKSMKIDFEGLESTQLKWLTLYCTSTPEHMLRMRETANLINFHDDLLDQSNLYPFSKEQLRKVMDCST